MMDMSVSSFHVKTVHDEKSIVNRMNTAIHLNFIKSERSNAHANLYHHRHGNNENLISEYRIYGTQPAQLSEICAAETVIVLSEFSAVDS